MESYIAIVVSLILFAMFCYMFSKMSRKIETVSDVVETVGLKQKKTNVKRGLRKSIKTVIKAFKTLAKQEPKEYKDSSQFAKFNIVMKDDSGKFSIYTCDDVIGKELIDAVEELGVDFALEKWL